MISSEDHMDQVLQAVDEEQYLVRNPKEVMQILNDLAKQKASIKVSFNHGTDVYLTTVIAVDVKSQVVHLDIGRDEEFNRRLFSSHHIAFFKEDGVKIKWTSSSVSEVSLRDGKAIKITLPKDMIRLQRREYYRFATPIANPVLCRIPLADESSPEEDKEIELILLDVSLGGVGAIVAEPLDSAFVIGADLQHCKISFPDVGITNLTLRVRNIASMQTKDGVAKQRVGFQFIEPSRGNEGLIHRYVYFLERQAIALAHGKS